MKRLISCVVGLMLVLACAVAFAATPKDSVVIAWQIDDIITLDPAEIFEFSGAEYAGNTYDRLIGYDVEDVSKIYGQAAESWSVGEDGKTYTFRLRKGIKFASGNPLTARDAAFSLHRLILLDKSPAFILSQFGFSPENVRQKIRATDDTTLVLETDKVYAPTFLLYCLTATVGSVVDMKEVMAHEKDGDMGHAWLRTHYAGSGPFTLRQWKASEALFLDRNEHYWDGASEMKRVMIRHIAEPATQRLLLEKGDVDIARNLGPDQLDGLQGNASVEIQPAPKGGLFYLGLNQKNKILSNPKVRQALKYLVDYDGIAGSILKGSMVVHQAFLPRGFLGALAEKPFRLDVAKAKALLAEAGYPDGFSITMDTRNNFPTIDMAQSIQSTFAQAGVKLEIIPMDGKQALTKYRARNHEIYIGRWGPDYQDPHTNASTFAWNPDNADDASAKPLAWRNAWDIPKMTQKCEAAVREKDPEKRAQMYLALQKEHQEVSPFVIMFQDIEVIARRTNVRGFVLGPNFDSNFYRFITKE
ncbi:ABC transporter substrate-binding protein [Desulfonema ishimotonii]|uniref:ABC transporter substrate-binding protein n=1 Tax=Desulfonema ishimotonii TaxID=45657 RepID=A0A401FVR8_9BACT|nr:ABC transporter substrate-binding protein [Desulfonema ishimotonii]GBC61061.1 ABC transporter substrate-binding protein [Desulfonema ishimotonii]